MRLPSNAIRVKCSDTLTTRNLWRLLFVTVPSCECVHAEQSLRLRRAKRPRWQGRVQCQDAVLLETKYEVGSEVKKRLQEVQRASERQREETTGLGEVNRER